MRDDSAMSASFLARSLGTSGTPDDSAAPEVFQASLILRLLLLALASTSKYPMTSDASRVRSDRDDRIPRVTARLQAVREDRSCCHRKQVGDLSLRQTGANVRLAPRLVIDRDDEPTAARFG
jgi:hypothetical protein